MANRKDYQRHLNKVVHELNRDVKNDDLWRGRFVMFQKDAAFENFKDGSGGLLYTIMRIYDKATGYYKDYRIEYAPWMRHDWALWKAMNDFITEDAAVWNNNALNPREDKTDYHAVKIPISIFNAKINFYCLKNI